MARIYRKLFLGLAATLIPISLIGPARTQENCQTTCSRYEEGQCVETSKFCTPIPPSHSYGAIAYGRESKAYGYSYRMSSQADAERTAMQKCAEKGTDCEMMVWFDFKCGAVTAHPDSKTAYWGWGDGEGEARANAMTQCMNDGGGKCEVKVSQCSR